MIRLRWLPDGVATQSGQHHHHACPEIEGMAAVRVWLLFYRGFMAAYTDMGSGTAALWLDSIVALRPAAKS